MATPEEIRERIRVRLQEERGRRGPTGVAVLARPQPTKEPLPEGQQTIIDLASDVRAEEAARRAKEPPVPLIARPQPARYPPIWKVRTPEGRPRPGALPYPPGRPPGVIETFSHPLVDPIVARLPFATEAAREGATRRQEELGRALASMEMAPFLAVPPGALAAGGLAALGRELGAIGRPLRATVPALRRPQLAQAAALRPTGAVGPPGARVFPRAPLSPQGPIATDVVGTAGVPGRPLAETTIFEMPTTESMIEAAFATKGHERALNLANKVPGMRQFMRTFKEAAVADDPVAYATVLRGQMEDMAEGGVFLATVKSRFLSQTRRRILGRVGFYKPTVPVKDGTVVHPGVKQIRDLPGGTRSMAYHDIVEYAERYHLPPDVKRLVNEIRATSKNLAAYLEKEGVPIRRMKGESDWVYLHRVVESVQGDATSGLAIQVERLLGSQFPKVGNESARAYLARVIRAVDNGSLTPSRDLSAIIDALAAEYRVPVLRQSMLKPRQHQATIQGLEAGVKYADDAVDELMTQAQMTYRMVINNRIGTMLRSLTVDKSELIPAVVRQTAVDARARAAAAIRLDRAISAAQRGRRGIPGSTLRSVAEHFPEEAERLRAALSIRLPEFRRVISNLSGELKQHLGVTAKQFRAELAKIRIGQSLRQTAVDAARKVQSAVKLDRAISNALFGRRGIPGSTLRAVAKHFPEEAERLRAALSIRMPEFQRVITNLSGELKQHLGVTTKQFRTELAKVRTTGARTPVTSAQVTQVMKRLGANQRTSANMLRRIYHEATSFPIAEQKVLLDTLRADVKALLTAARSAATRATTAKARAAELAITPEMGQVIGVPGVSGRVIPTQVIGGKQVLGRDLATEIRRQFGYMPKGVAEKLVGHVGLAADIYRLGKASLDQGIQMIQLLGTLGIDFAQLVTYPFMRVPQALGLPIKAKLTAIFPRAGLKSYWTFLDPRHELNYWLRPEVQARTIRRLQHGSLIQPSEFTAGQAGLRRVVERVPGFGPRLGQFVGQTFGRADAAWSAGRNIAGDLTWAAFEDMAAQAGNLRSLAKMTNLTTGVLSLRGMGTPAFKRNFLRAFGFFSPRYTYATVALVGNIFAGGFTSRMALKSVLGIMGFNTTFFTLAAIALGQKPAINPLPKSMGGDGADLWTVKIGNRRVGFGGAIYAPLRLIANVASAAVDEPERLLRFDSQNPIVSSYRGRAAGPTSLVWDYVTGRGFRGELTREMGRLRPTKETLDWMKTIPMPIWMEAMAEEGGGVAGAIAEWFGLRSFPEGYWTEYRSLVEEATGQDFGDVSDLDKARLEIEIPEIAEALKAAQQDSARRGWNPVATTYWQLRDDARADRDNKVALLQEGIDEGNQSYTQAVDYIQQGNRELGARYKQIESEERFKGVIRDLEQAEESKFPEDAAYREYWDIWFGDSNYNDFGEPLHDKREEALLAFQNSLPVDVWEKVQERLAVERLHAPRLLQEYYSDMDSLQAYWDIPKLLIGDKPGVLEQYNEYLSLSGVERTDYKKPRRELSDAIDDIAAARKKLRDLNYTIARLRNKWFGDKLPERQS